MYQKNNFRAWHKKDEEYRLVESIEFDKNGDAKPIRIRNC